MNLPSVSCTSLLCSASSLTAAKSGKGVHYLFPAATKSLLLSQFPPICTRTRSRAVMSRDVLSRAHCVRHVHTALSRDFWRHFQKLCYVTRMQEVRMVAVVAAAALLSKGNPVVSCVGHYLIPYNPVKEHKNFQHSQASLAGNMVCELYQPYPGLV